MTRDELIEVVARAITEAEIDHRPLGTSPAVSMSEAALKAIEDAGYAIMRADGDIFSPELMKLEEYTGSIGRLSVEAYNAMIEAGRIK